MPKNSSQTPSGNYTSKKAKKTSKDRLWSTHLKSEVEFEKTNSDEGMIMFLKLV